MLKVNLLFQYSVQLKNERCCDLLGVNHTDQSPQDPQTDQE